MAVHFITLTIVSGKIRVNPEHIASIQDLGAGHPGQPRTNVLAGQTLFVMESEREIMDACAHATAPMAQTPDSAAPIEGPKAKAGRPGDSDHTGTAGASGKAGGPKAYQRASQKTGRKPQ